MKFLDLNGVATLWNKIKSSFIPYNPSGTSLTIEENERLQFDTTPDVGIRSYVGIGGPYPLWVSDTKDEHSAAFAVQIDDKVSTIMLTPYSTTNIAEPWVYLSSDGLKILNAGGYTSILTGNTLELFGHDSDITIDGESVIPQAIEDSWLNSNLI